MSILPVSLIGGLASRPVQSRSKAGFSVPEKPEATSGSAPLSRVSADPLLFLQEVEPPEERDARSRRHGGALLDLLSSLQRALLDGGDGEAVMQSLSALAGRTPVAANSSLQAAIEAISLRAHVELARSEAMRGRLPARPATLS